ncbi:MAG TPA: hypothetical protein VMT73_11090 [Anaerolineales bacterium]|nr:hypothetical protein [Anaerolineales bacterium]
MRRRSYGGFGINRWVVKTEHILGFAIFLIVFSSLFLFLGAMIQAGYGATVVAMANGLLIFLGATPWYIWLIVDIVAVAFLALAGGRGE